MTDTNTMRLNFTNADCSMIDEGSAGWESFCGKYKAKHPAYHFIGKDYRKDLVGKDL